MVIKIHGKQGAELRKVEDFLVEWDFSKPREVKKQSIKEMKEVLTQIANSMNRGQQKKQTRKSKNAKSKES